MAETEESNDGVEVPVLNVHEAAPGRTVFTEDGNTDGWISTDLTVTPPR